ncbi:hypothetical protein NDU88_003621 [Pleurodeles waltl]|uniref:Uncharacterized protein n=1 Tax=Pleurodeles waltl TaxID=8319 RepID=A0AAV7NL75_PLEWA|nr:hypothetical protein NDU88_003621 [Pleurodeles waltl]
MPDDCRVPNSKGAACGEPVGALEPWGSYQDAKWKTLRFCPGRMMLALGDCKTGCGGKDRDSSSHLEESELVKCIMYV